MSAITPVAKNALAAVKCNEPPWMLLKAPLPSSFLLLLCLETALRATSKALVSGYQGCLALHVKATANCH